MRYVQRACGKRVSSLLRQFPVLCILGPRQCGKTFFARHKLSDWRYFDLEKPAHQAQVEEDPRAILTQFQHHLIFDEAQRLPNLFPILRSFVGKQGRLPVSCPLPRLGYVGQEVRGVPTFQYTLTPYPKYVVLKGKTPASPHSEPLDSIELVKSMGAARKQTQQGARDPLPSRATFTR